MAGPIRLTIDAACQHGTDVPWVCFYIAMTEVLYAMKLLPKLLKRNWLDW